MPVPDSLTCTLFCLAALTVAGVAQTAWYKLPVSARFARPLDGGRTYQGQRVFGDNKTWRGLIVMVPATGLSFWLTRALLEEAVLWPLTGWQYALLGSWTGLGFMLGELPNSFLKRRWAIPPGEPAPPGTGRAILFALDQVDSILGGLLALSLVVSVPLWTWVHLLLVGAVVHWAFNGLFVLVGLKTRAS